MEGKGQPGKVVHFNTFKEGYAANYDQPMFYYISGGDELVTCEDKLVHQIHDTHPYDGILLSRPNLAKLKSSQEQVKEKEVHDLLNFPEDKPVMGDCGTYSCLGKAEFPYKTEEILSHYETLGFDYGVSIAHLIMGKYTKDEAERQRRYKLTINKAEDFIEQYQTGDYTFTPIGVAQGWDAASYREAVVNLIEMGYEYVVLEGLAGIKSKKIKIILEKIAPIIPAYLKLHLSGVSNLNRIKDFRKLGVTSFDLGGHLPQAWLDSRNNYISLEEIKNSGELNSDNKYTAIWVPQISDHTDKIQKLIEAGLETEEGFKEREENVLAVLRKYHQGEVEFTEVYRIVMEYEKTIQKNYGKLQAKEKLTQKDLDVDKIYTRVKRLYQMFQTSREFAPDWTETAENEYDKIVQIYQKLKILYEVGDDKQDFGKTKNIDYERLKEVYTDLNNTYGKAKEKIAEQAGKYKKTLINQPWKKCGCKICQEDEERVILLRSNKQNYRRKCHNIYVFYNKFKNLIK